MRLRVGCTFSDRIEAFLDGRVGVAGAELDMRIVEPQRLFRSVLRDADFDIAELSMASHIAAMGAGRRTYRALPVFLSRSFRHSNLYVRADRVSEPAALAGKRIGLIDYQQTAALWLRGILADDYNVARQSVEWVAGGLHRPVIDDRMPSRPAAGIRLCRTPGTLDSLLRSGALDAVISPTAPESLADASVPTERMWPEFVAVESDWWRRTGIFPIMHVLVVRRSLIDAHPAFATALTAAFEEALKLAAADLPARDFPKVALPWLSAQAAGVRDRLGADPWTYGIEANLAALQTMLRYAAEDGLTPHQLSIAELFA